jgi:putative membrane protein
MRIRMWIAASLALGMIAVGACDRREDRQTTGAPRGSTHGDQDFMVSACNANLAEIEAGRLAESKATSADVKKFAQQMVEDHSLANGELTSLAEKMTFRLPTRPDDAHQRELAKLAGTSGAEFDRKYMEMMVSDHQKAVSLFEKHSKDAKNDEVRTWAEKTLPTLRHHLTMARDLNSKVETAPKAD